MNSRNIILCIVYPGELYIRSLNIHDKTTTKRRRLVIKTSAKKQKLCNYLYKISPIPDEIFTVIDILNET